MAFKINGRTVSPGTAIGAFVRATFLCTAGLRQPPRYTAGVEIGPSAERSAAQNLLISRVQAKAGRAPIYLSSSERGQASKLARVAKKRWVDGLPVADALDALASYVLKRILQHFDMSMSRVDVPMTPILQSTILRKIRKGYPFPSKPLLATLQLRNSIRVVATKAR